MLAAVPSSHRPPAAQLSASARSVSNKITRRVSTDEYGPRKHLVELVRENVFDGRTEVDLREKNLGDAGALSVADALRTNTTWVKLSLQNNRIGAAGGAAIAKSMLMDETLTVLALNNNNVGAAGATAIAESLQANQTLTALGLADNMIGDAGATTIADALRTNQTLTELWLQAAEKRDREEHIWETKGKTQGGLGRPKQ